MSARLALYLQPDVWELSLKLWDSLKAVLHSLRHSIATLSSIFCSGALTKKQGGAFAEGQGQVKGKDSRAFSSALGIKTLPRKHF